MGKLKMTKEYIEMMDRLINDTIEIAKKTDLYSGCVTAYLLPQLTDEQRNKLEPYIVMAVLEDPSLNIEKMKQNFKNHIDEFGIE